MCRCKLFCYWSKKEAKSECTSVQNVVYNMYNKGKDVQTEKNDEKHD